MLVPSTTIARVRRKIDVEEGIGLVREYVQTGALSEAAERTAVRFALEEFATRHPGRSVEIRVPWVGAVQAIAGPRHTRGTPPNVVEMPARVWLDLVVGNDADTSLIDYSGARADLGEYLPLFGPAELGGANAQAPQHE